MPRLDNGVQLITNRLVIDPTVGLEALQLLSLFDYLRHWRDSQNSSNCLAWAQSSLVTAILEPSFIWQRKLFASLSWAFVRAQNHAPVHQWLLWHCRKKPGWLGHSHTTNQLMHQICSYSMKLIGLRKVLEAHLALSFASCYMTSSNFPLPNNFRRILALVH